MALNVGELEATLRLKDQMSAELKKVEQSTDTFASSMKRMGAVVAAAFTVTKLIQFGKESVQAYSEQENALVKLETAMRSQGRYTSELAKRYEEFGSQFQRTTIYADELVHGMEALLIQVGNVAPEAMEGALTASTNLAAGLGVDLRAATMLVAKAFAGETGSLTRYGIIIDETAKKTQGAAAATVQAIEQSFGGQAQAQAATFAGKLAQLNNSWGDFQEVVGKVLVDIIMPLLPALKTAATGMQGLGSAVEIARGYFDSFVAAGFSTLKFLADAQIKILSMTNAFGINDKAIASLRQTSFEYGEMAKAVTQTQTGVTKAVEENTKAVRIQTVVNEEQRQEAEKHAKALAAVDLKILEATRDIGHLTTAQEASILAYKEIGLSAEEMALKLNVSALAVSRFVAEQEKATSAMAAHWGNVGSILDQVFGVDTLQKATQWVDAVDALGGSIASLSNDDLRNLRTAMSDALDVMGRTGRLTTEQASRFASLGAAAAGAAIGVQTLAVAEAQLAAVMNQQGIGANFIGLDPYGGSATTATGSPNITAFLGLNQSTPTATAGMFRAAGGPVSPGRPYIVGERGPELFMPSSVGSILPSGASTTVNVYVTQPLGTPDAIGKAVMQSLRAQGVRLPIGV